jgi:hypothetical protein
MDTPSQRRAPDTTEPPRPACARRGKALLVGALLPGVIGAAAGEHRQREEAPEDRRGREDEEEHLGPPLSEPQGQLAVLRVDLGD